jgi:hypothetical protein
MKTPIRFLFTLLCAAIVSLPSVHATTYTVQNTGDGAANAANCPGSGCRLRDALAKVVDGDMIDFSVTTPATITLTNGELVVGNSITITGLGANLLTVDANHNSRVFFIDSGLTVTISGLTITNGSASGGVFPDDAGGGIFNDHATLMLNNSTLSGNSASFAGGILNYGIMGSATLTINNSTLSGNSATDGDAGGIYNYGFMGSATLTINNSTLSGNSATDVGGGIVNNNGLIGGSGATLTVSNSTLSGNSAISGGGIWNGFGLTLTIGSTILNAGASGQNIFNEVGTVISLGYNLSSDDASTLLNQSTDQNSTDPKLGPLRDNGGPTFTHGLFTGSPAIDKGSNPLFLLTDQRGPGFPRTIGNETDVGAFEGVQPLVCPLGLGYWKNNPAAWPVTSLTLGGMTYSKSVLLKILGTPIGKRTKADASLILADQLIAAKLNIANGTDGTPVSSTIMNADSLLTAQPVGSHVKPSTSTGQAMVNDANVLNNYNNGVMTLGCGL